MYISIPFGVKHSQSCVRMGSAAKAVQISGTVVFGNENEGAHY